MIQRSLKDRLAKGIKHTGLAAIAIHLIGLVQLVVMARLLEPQAFGLAGIATVVIGFTTLFVDMGIGSVLIQRQNLSRAELSSLFWANLLLGATFFGLVNLAAPLVARVYAEPQVPVILFWASLTFLFSPCGQFFRFIAEKELVFGRLVVIEVCSTVLGVGTAVWLAYTSWGVLAIVLGSLVGVVFQAIALVVNGARQWRPLLRFRPSDLNDHLDFGLYLVAQRTLNYLTANIDYILIGIVFGSQALGYYTVAYELANKPASKINPILSRVFFPVLSKMQDDPDRLRRAYFKMQELSAAICIPLLVGLAVMAPVAVPVVFGATWLPAVPLVQVLCLVGITRSIGATVGPLLLARGRSDLGFRWSVLLVSLQVPAICIGVASGSPLGVAIAFAAIQVVAVALNYWILVRILIGPCFPEYSGAIWPSLTISLLTAGAVLLVSWPAAELPLSVLLGFQLLVGLGCYVLLVKSFNKALFDEFVAIVLRKEKADYV